MITEDRMMQDSGYEMRLCEGNRAYNRNRYHSEDKRQVKKGIRPEM